VSERRAERGPAVGRARLRREARERAIELAYEQVQRSMTVDELIATLTLEPDAFTEDLLRAAEDRRAEADEIVTARLRGWAHDRLPVIDQLVLRLATVELMTTDTPTGVVLAEAVDMASRYSTEESAKFVNGVLSAVAAQVRPDQ
jgi:N utilization substance protein B